MDALIRWMAAAGGGPPGCQVAAVDPDTRRDRYRGCLLGLAAGNALGLPVEGISRAAIGEVYPRGVREVEAQERRMPWDDDLAQAELLARCILEHDTMPPRPLAAGFEEWLRTNGRGAGYLTRLVIEEFSGAAPEDAARLVWEREGRNAAGNGAVMRCAPVAMRWRRDPRRMIEETHASARITHHDPRCGWSAVAVNAALALALEGHAPRLADLAGALDEAGAPLEVGRAVGAVIGASLDDLRLDASREMGYTLKAMQAGLWACLEEGSLETVLVRIVNAGGDADTNGAVAGAILGARHGATAIPGRWLDNIRDVGTLTGIADRLQERADAGIEQGGPVAGDS